MSPVAFSFSATVTGTAEESIELLSTSTAEPSPSSSLSPQGQSNTPSASQLPSAPSETPVSSVTPSNTVSRIETPNSEETARVNQVSQLPEVFAQFVGECPGCSFSEGEYEIPYGEDSEIEFDLMIEGISIGSVTVQRDILPEARSNGFLRVTMLRNSPDSDIYGDILIDATLVDVAGNVVPRFALPVQICLQEDDYQASVHCFHSTIY